MRRILITGGTGFFGKSILDYRLRHPAVFSNCEITVLSRNPQVFCDKYPTLANQNGLSWIKGDIRDFSCAGEGYDEIIHAATTIDLQNVTEMQSSIIDGTRRVIDFAKSTGVKKILYTSSGAVYGTQFAPASEEFECAPNTPYGQGKLEAEEMLLESGLDIKIARCFAFVGAFLNREIYYAIGNFIQNCVDNTPITINGDGTPLRSYLYADDLVEWLFAVLDRGEAGRPYNIGSDRVLSIKELAEKVRDVLGANNEIVVREKPGGGVPQMYAPNIKRIQEELGCTIKVSLEDAISRSAL